MKPLHKNKKKGRAGVVIIIGLLLGIILLYTVMTIWTEVLPV